MARKSTSDESTTLSTESLTESLCEEEVSYVLKHLDMTMEDLGKIANVVGGKIFGSTISNIVDTKFIETHGGYCFLYLLAAAGSSDRGK